MNLNQIKRQGDVALERIENLPSQLNERNMSETKSLIIARGEHSNHCHAVVGEDAKIYEDSSGNVYVSSEFEFELKHLLETNLISGIETWTREHTPIKFPAGNYIFRPQYEYHPYEDEIRRMLD